jgi:hypothetical protein
VTRDGGIADHRHLELREGQRLDDLLAGHHPVDELLLGLDASVRVAVADLIGGDLREFRAIGVELRLSEDLDALGDRRLVTALRAHGAAEDKAGRSECECACNDDVTTRHVHMSLLRMRADSASSRPPAGIAR